MIHCKYDDLLELNKFKPHPKNRNKHSKEQIDRLVKLYGYHGIRHPIIVSKLSGYIVAGHGRLEAARKAKLPTFPVVYQEFENEEKEYAFLQADNAIALWAELDLSGIGEDIIDFDPNFDSDMLGIKNFDIGKVFEPKADEDAVPDVKEEPITKLGDLYQLGEHRLLCGDSTNIQHVERLMNGEKAEICFTSPPYADQREYNGKIELSVEHIKKFITSSFNLVNYFVINLGYSRKNKEVNQYWNEYIDEARACGLLFLSWNIWDKCECGSIGNQNAMFGISHEWIFIFGKETKELNLTVENKSRGERANHTGNRQKDGTIKKSKERIIRSHSQLKTVYSAPAEKARDEINHVARFPVHFPESYIEAMTESNHIVYDPFGGSGSTLIACEKTNRKRFMMELDPHYCDVIVKRWEQYTGKKAELISGKEE